MPVIAETSKFSALCMSILLSGHTTARRHGYGVRKVSDAETGEHIGWRVSHIKSRKRKESTDETSNTN